MRARQLVWYLPKKPIRQPTAEQREKVDADHESVKDLFRAASAFAFGQVKKQGGDEENGQNIPHPVKLKRLHPSLPMM
jgi:hypothetical protein